MPTRIKRPSVLRALAVTSLLVAFQGYLGYSALKGQFGIESNQQMLEEIRDLNAQSNALKAEIDAFRHKNSLFDPTSLDPDILTERARALLAMAQPDDVVVMVDPDTGLPKLSSPVEVPDNRLINNTLDNTTD